MNRESKAQVDDFFSTLIAKNMAAKRVIKNSKIIIQSCRFASILSAMQSQAIRHKIEYLNTYL